MPIDRSRLITKSDKAEAEFKRLAANFQIAVQTELDSKAKAMGYDSIATAVSYADEPSVAKFQQEGQRLRQWRSLVWEYCYTELDKVKAGTRPVPELDAFLTELPQLA